MKKIILILLGLCVAFFCWLVWAIFGGDQKLYGERGVSQSIEFSKENSLYIVNYQLKGGNTIKTKGSSYNILNCFLEKGWVHGKKYGDIEYRSWLQTYPYQLVMILKEEDKMYALNWELEGISQSEFGGYSNNVKYSMLKAEEVTDTLRYILIVGDNLFASNSKKDTLRELIFIKK